MKPEYTFLPSFVSSARDTLETMAFTSCFHQAPLARDNSKSWGDISGIIPIESETMKGVMVLSFEKDCALSLASRVLGEEFSTISDEVVDVVDELTNIISGGFKADLNQLGHKFELALPRVVVGKGVDIPDLKDDFLTLPFSTDTGSFVIEAQFVMTNDQDGDHE